MKKLFKKDYIPVGLAMFSMFFGAGNVVFPLAVGQYAGDKNLFAIIGLIITAAIMPIIGVIAMILFDGNHKNFFGRLGKAPGFLLALLIICLLGPLGSTPRCIALSYTTLTSAHLVLSPILFSLAACIIVYIFSVKKHHILTWLAWVLTPLLLTSLIVIIMIGIFTPHAIATTDHTNFAVFLHGLKEGYNTMDLLAAFFFSSTILNILKSKCSAKENETKSYASTALKASLIGAALLIIVYIGFSYLASLHSYYLSSHQKGELLAAIIMNIAGPYAGWLVCITVVLACLTTAIALISAFTDFIHREVFKESVSYRSILIVSLAITFFISTFEFTGISQFLGPILQICYPALIALTFLNIAHHLGYFKPIKTPIFAIFMLALFFYLKPF